MEAVPWKKWLTLTPPNLNPNLISLRSMHIYLMSKGTEPGFSPSIPLTISLLLNAYLPLPLRRMTKI
jgi:hypothetical protein